jgi:hypothetical protein
MLKIVNGIIDKCIPGLDARQTRPLREIDNLLTLS